MEGEREAPAARLREVGPKRRRPSRLAAPCSSAATGRSRKGSVSARAPSSPASRAGADPAAAARLHSPPMASFARPPRADAGGKRSVKNWLIKGSLSRNCSRRSTYA